MKNGNNANPARSQKGQGVPNLTEDEAREHLESLLWPGGVAVCPHCNGTDDRTVSAARCSPVPKLRKAIHGHGRDNFRGQPHPAIEMDKGFSSHRIEQEGNQREPATAQSWLW